MTRVARAVALPRLYPLLSAKTREPVVTDWMNVSTRATICSCMRTLAYSARRIECRRLVSAGEDTMVKRSGHVLVPWAVARDSANRCKRSENEKWNDHEGHAAPGDDSIDDGGWWNQSRKQMVEEPRHSSHKLSQYVI